MKIKYIDLNRLQKIIFEGINFIKLENTSVSQQENVLIDINWVRKINDFLEEKHFNNNELINMSFSENQKLNKINMEIVKEILENNHNNHTSLNKIIENYKKKDDSISFSRETLRKFLRQRMKLTYRRIYPKHKNTLSMRNMTIDKLFLCKIIQILIKRERIIYIDESTFSNVKKPLKTWTNNKNEEMILFPGRIPSINLIVAVSEGRIDHFQISEAMNTEIMMIQFIGDLVSKLNQNSDERYWLYLDNASVHKGKSIKRYFKDKNLNVIYGVPYTPQYNMAEFLFSILKISYYQMIFLNK